MHAAPAHVLDLFGGDAGALQQRLHDVRRQVLGTDVAEIPSSEDARPIGVRTASMTTAFFIGRILSFVGRAFQPDFQRLSGWKA